MKYFLLFLCKIVVIIILLQISSVLNIFYNNLIFVNLLKMSQTKTIRKMGILKINIKIIIMLQN